MKINLTRKYVQTLNGGNIEGLLFNFFRDIRRQLVFFATDGRTWLDRKENACW